MHPQITAALKKVDLSDLKPSAIAQNNAEKVLNYIDDLNLEHDVKFSTASSGSLFISWVIGDWKYQMECVKNGYIIYTFTKSDYQVASGCELYDDFIPQFEKYLLML